MPSRTDEGLYGTYNNNNFNKLDENNEVNHVEDVPYKGIKDENSVFRIEEEEGNVEVFIRGNLNVSGDFSLNGQNSFQSTHNSTTEIINQNFSGNTLEINAKPHKNKKNIDGGFIVKRYQKESGLIFVDSNWVLEDSTISLANIGQPSSVLNFVNNKSSNYNPSNSTLTFSDQDTSLTSNKNFFVTVVQGDSLVLKEVNLGTKEGYTRSELGRDMIRVFDETGVELQVHWGKDNDKHNNSDNYYKKVGHPLI